MLVSSHKCVSSYRHCHRCGRRCQPHLDDLHSTTPPTRRLGPTAMPTHIDNSPLSCVRGVLPQKIGEHATLEKVRPTKESVSVSVRAVSCWFNACMAAVHNACVGRRRRRRRRQRLLFVCVLSLDSSPSPPLRRAASPSQRRQGYLTAARRLHSANAALRSSRWIRSCHQCATGNWVDTQ